jgi:peptidoglycan/xylan/chitin deacetylase (PgdA/CDA1 family)
MIKHKLKMGLRETYARVLFHTGLHALVNKVMPRRLTILAGHCVAPGAGDPPWPGGEHLPGDMKIAREKLEHIVGWFAKRYEMVTIDDGVRSVDNGGGGRSLVALSMDDGYKDNHDVMLPLLKRMNVPATVFLESRPLDEHKVNWSHKLFWILAQQSAFDFVHAYGEATDQRAPFPEMNQLVTEGREVKLTYHVKRILKYEADPADRDLGIDAAFAALGGDERELCEALYMSWDDARALRDGGVELGGHTVGHAILSRLDAEGAKAEIGGGREAMCRELGTEPKTFAYPFGRRWDFHEDAEKAITEVGFERAVTMHAGTNGPRAAATTMRRLAIDDDVQLHLLATEACGGFDLMRRFGVDLSE